MTAGAIAEESDEAGKAAFEQRFEDLEMVFEDWTGINQEGENRTLQSSGEAVIDAGIALGSFLTFTAQLASDLGMSADEVKTALDELFEGMAARDAAEGDDEDDEDDEDEDDDDDDDDDDEDAEPGDLPS